MKFTPIFHARAGGPVASVRDIEFDGGSPLFVQLRRAPTATLHETVREVWLVQAERCRTAVERVLPDAGAEIYVNLGAFGRHLYRDRVSASPSARSAWVVGPHARSLLIEKETQ